MSVHVNKALASNGFNISQERAPTTMAGAPTYYFGQFSIKNYKETKQFDPDTPLDPAMGRSIFYCDCPHSEGSGEVMILHLSVCPRGGGTP